MQPISITAHKLARMLLKGPNLPVTRQSDFSGQLLPLDTVRVIEPDGEKSARSRRVVVIGGVVEPKPVAPVYPEPTTRRDGPVDAREDY